MSAVTVDAMGAIVRSFLADGRQPDVIAAGDRLSDLGVDSLTTLNVLLAAAERFGLDLSALDESMDVPDTVGDVVELLRRLGP